MSRFKLRAPIRASLSGALSVAGDVQSQSGFALQFPSNLTGSDTSEPLVAIMLANPQSNGLPIWGAGGGGVSWVRKISVIQQTGYYAQIWWCNNGTFNWNGGSPGSYWGAHPYPTNSNNSGTSHVWEVATDTGGDFFNSAGSSDVGQGTAVTKGSTYTQGMRITRAGVSDKTLTFYFNLPNVDAANRIGVNVTSANYGESDPPSPVLMIGDSPWFADFQHERASMVLDAIKIFTPALSEADMASEATDFTQLVTSAGQSNIWWGKDGFADIDDLTCAFGTGHALSWANANKGTLVARL